MYYIGRGTHRVYTLFWERLASVVGSYQVCEWARVERRFCLSLLRSLLVPGFVFTFTRGWGTGDVRCRMSSISDAYMQMSFLAIVFL